MTTPNTTNIPAPRVPFVDERTGVISREWFRFLNNQFQLTGGGTTAISLADLELAPYSDAATEAERLLADAGNKLGSALLEFYPAVVWEDQDECLDVRPEDIPL